MRALLTFLSITLCISILVVVPHLIAPSYLVEYGPVTVFDVSAAILLCLILAAGCGLLIYRSGDHGHSLLTLFIAALLVRMAVATTIFVFHWQDFFGGDALTYDYYGLMQAKGWNGDSTAGSIASAYIGEGIGPGWGMVYLVGGVYSLVGHNMLAVQFVNCVMGAATVAAVFLSAYQIFSNLRVARLAAVIVAFYPSLVLWSSQGLKDGPIVFFLALAVLSTLKLGQRFSITQVTILGCSLFALMTLRFYIFYMMVVAIGGAFVIGMRAFSTKSFVRQFVVIVVLGLAMTYLGVIRYVGPQFERYGNLQKIQLSRLDASTTAETGFAKDVDVSTTSGALSTIPLGLLYLLFAPFPWQLGSLRQSITLPEMITWWASFPMLVLGFWFSVRYRLRQISPILIFTVMLSLAYSVFQGNVGTAYRQRAQLLVFYFIFVAVGYVLMLEKREERKRVELATGEKFPTGTITGSTPPG